MHERTPLRVWLISDLHVNTSDFELPSDVDFDVLVIAGDIDEGMDATFDWLRKHVASLGKPVILTPGNHDHYAGDLHVEQEMISRGAALGVTVLYSGQSIMIGDVRFVGAVLWTDYAVADDVLAAQAWARTGMPDMRSIDVGMRRVYTKDLVAEHRRHLQGIVDVLAQPHHGPTVVVTHHAPHPRSLRDGYASEPADASFASNLGWVMAEHAPTFWMHGHVHDPFYYTVHDTDVLCNPRGYVTKDEVPYLENDRFDPRFVVEV